MRVRLTVRSNLSWRHCRRRSIWRFKLENSIRNARPGFPKIELDNARKRFLDYPEFLKLPAALPEGLQDPVSFLYHSGWRISEMRQIEWRHLDGTTLVLPPALSKSDGRRIGDFRKLWQKACVAVGLGQWVEENPPTGKAGMEDPEEISWSNLP